MKKFFNSTVLGLTAGILLAGYAVFAYTSPTVAPPGGNVPAPLNVGVGNQVKVGGLWAGSLGVDGGVTIGGSIKIGGFATLPVCGIAQKGTFVFNTTAGKPYVCDGSGWQVASAGIDNDGDWVVRPTDCNDSNANIWQFLTGYADNDADTYTLTATSACSGASLPSPYLSAGSPSVDCNDSCATCYPGSTATTASPDGKDQDCNGIVDNATAQSYSCSYPSDPPARAIKSADDAACTALCGGTVSGNTSSFCGTIKNTFSWSSCSPSGGTISGCQPVYYPSSTCTCPAVYH